MLQTHCHIGHGVPEHGKCKNRAPPELVRDGAENHCSHKESRKGRRGKRCLIGKAKQSLRADSKDTTGNETRADVGSLKQVVHLKKCSERKQYDQTPDRPAGWQLVDARRDFCWTVSGHS